MKQKFLPMHVEVFSSIFYSRLASENCSHSIQSSSLMGQICYIMIKVTTEHYQNKFPAEHRHNCILSIILQPGGLNQINIQ
jgi:hypothetical protein